MDWNGPAGMHGFSRRTFNEYYRCYSIALMPGNEREGLNYGGKILLPPSALAKLSTLNIAYPMLFEITNDAHKEHSSHAGVLEFIAEEGKAYLPQWMMTTLLIEEGSLARIKNVSLPLGRFVKLQPQSVDFLDITDPKAVLEKAIGQFACLTQNDIITIKYNSKLYDILIMESKPGNKGISVIETDLEVDFAAPLGYKEPERVPKQALPPSDSLASIESHTKSETKGFAAFNGSGNRLSGKESALNIKEDSKAPAPVSSEKVAPAALHLPHGKLFFGYPIVPFKKPGSESEEPEVPKFTGPGQTLRAAKKK
ncbi:ubiquitin fusion degradation protein UFD1-containing protein [Chytriomyces cf. hyalinus JEL632]|nr:ubiquitin fusion degradation protein UFD1-containing protein [Chytriomyces cf. hyalinus JEL632]